MGSESELKAAASFLYPVLHRDQTFKARGRSVIECLHSKLDTDHTNRDDEHALRVSIIRRALELLLRIHRALKEETLEASGLIQDLSKRKTVDGLLDLISLEGIYPCLSPGVGIPIERRVKSVLQNGVVTKISPSGEGRLQSEVQNLLVEICLALDEILEDGNGLAHNVQERTFVDLIAGFGELAYYPLLEDKSSKSPYSPRLNRLLDRTPSNILYPSLTSLLHPASPVWFRSPISAYLSLLPLRPQGVKHTISFIATSMPQGPPAPGASLPNMETRSSTQSISLEVITHASKVLSSVPSSTTADKYFAKLAPQLLQLLDERDVDDRRAAAYIIGNGILGRRKHGSPGAIGWKLFAQPIIEALNPGSIIDAFDSSRETDPGRHDIPSVVVLEASVEQALHRLCSLVLLHPNPGLTKRLVEPCLLSLWELLCYSQDTKRLLWVEEIHKVLCTYFKTSVAISKLLFLVDNLLWDESLPWMYGAGPAGGVEIRKQVKNFRTTLDLNAAMERVDLRIGVFMTLLRSGVASDDDVAVLFVHVCKNWLVGGARKKSQKKLMEDEGVTKNPFYDLLNAKVTQEILKEHKDKLAVTPRRIIELISQLLTAFITSTDEGNPPTRPPSSPSLSSLVNITNDSIHPNQLIFDESSKEEATEIVSVSLSLLSAVLSSPEFSLDPETYRLLNDLHQKLGSFTSLGSLPPSLLIAARNASALLGLQISLHSSHNATTKPTSDPYASDRKEYHEALSSLTDALPPIRAQGISLLTSLIEKASPVIDIQATTVLLQSVLQDEDEFIYLSAIKTLGLLAARHPKTVLRMLVEGYVDSDEKSSLDVRIRTGEALLKTIESLGTTLVEETAKMIGESMIAVAGRRAKKPKSASSRHQERQREERSRQEAEEAWGGEIPSAEIDTEEESLTHILAGWQGHLGAEDLRVRASALSILGTCIETSLASLGSSLTSSAIDVGLSILSLEPGPEAAILRRAAVLLVLSLTKALDAAAEMGKNIESGFSLQARTVRDVIDSLQRVGEVDADEIVRGHSRVAVEALETWMEKSMMRGVRELGKGFGGWNDINRGFEIRDTGLRGLAVDPDRNRGDNVIEKRPRIEEL